MKHINEVLRVSIDNPDLMNELKAVQLRELAALNGTLREDVAPACTNCGSTEHRFVDAFEIFAVSISVSGMICVLSHYVFIPWSLLLTLFR